MPIHLPHLPEPHRMYREVRAFYVTNASKSCLSDNAVSPVFRGGRGLKQDALAAGDNLTVVSPVFRGGRGLKQIKRFEA